MGPHLRGEAGPFTPSGRASYARGIVSYAAGATEANQVGHRGMLLRFRAPKGHAEALLPHPLESVEHTDQVYLFLNQTQTARGLEVLASEPSQLTNWHEAWIMIPCSFEGTSCIFPWVLYKDHYYDHGILLGLYRGQVTKGAAFNEIFPFAAQPLNREMEAGGACNMAVSRFGERIITGSFLAAKELSEAEIASEIDLEELLNVVGIRYMPDWTDPKAQPLVHDLVLWNYANRKVSRAWSGEGDVVFGESDNEELNYLQPVEQLPSHYLHLQYQGGPGMCRLLHDYVDWQR